MLIFEEEYNNLKSPIEKEQYLAHLLKFVAEAITVESSTSKSIEHLKRELQIKTEELEKANATIERAREFYKEAKADLETAEKRAYKDVYRKLQIVRDRVCAILDTTLSAGERMESSSRAKVTFDELNNIIFAANSIIEEMCSLNLWAETDSRPITKEFKETTSAKRGKRTKTDRGTEMEKQISFITE